LKTFALIHLVARRLVIHIRQAKGGKDRYVMLSEQLLGIPAISHGCKSVNAVVGLVGWSVIREPHWWAGPPHQRAARIVTAQWLKHMSWGAFLNKISSLPPLYLTEFTVRRPYILQPNHGGRNVADTF
jgi:hypothetical protein